MPTPVVVRTQEEIEEVLDRCCDADQRGRSEYPGMTYEQGVRCALDWILDLSADPVFDD